MDPTAERVQTGLPLLASPWRRAASSGSDVRVTVAHVTDPACPWAYSFEPVLRALEMRYGDQLVWRTVMIGLVETLEDAERRGATPGARAQSALNFRRLGMPITPHVRERVTASSPACRLVRAAALQAPALGEAVLRALRFAWFTSDLLVDTDDALAAVCASVEGLDAERALTDLHGDAVREEYERDRREARTPFRAAVTLGRTANSDGAERHTAPTLVLAADDGRSAVVPGFQPFEAAELALLNLEPRLVRLPVPTLTELLAHYPGGLTSQEVARVLADTTTPPDRAAAEAALLELAATGNARRIALGDDALWCPGLG